MIEAIKVFARKVRAVGVWMPVLLGTKVLTVATAMVALCGLMPQVAWGEVTPVKVSGTSDDYYVKFTSSGSWTAPANSSNFCVLLVGGGGGGGGHNGGGGGAGELYYGTPSFTIGQPYTITVGAGGNGGVGDSPSVGGLQGKNGNPSSISGTDVNLTVKGGGGGGSGLHVSKGNAPGLDGGSGGGGAGYINSGNSTSGGETSQSATGSLVHKGGGGYYGGDGSGILRGGGGGGAGSAGTTATASAVGNGGSGKSYDITGQNVEYAKGGAGSGATAGTLVANTGSGGAGKGPSTAGESGAAGVVIIRYTIQTHTHNYTSVVTTPVTCTTPGVKTCTCQNSGCDRPTYTESIPATGHSWSAWTPLSATQEKRMCSVCFHEETRFISTPMSDPSWGYEIHGLGDSGNEVALVYTNATLNNMTWQVPAGVKQAELLVVAGGGSGGRGNSGSPGGGGGAGGFWHTNGVAVTEGQTYAIKVGQGAKPVYNTTTSTTVNGEKGDSSSISISGGYSLTVPGGGGGSYCDPKGDVAFMDGGCGGGGSKMTMTDHVHWGLAVDDAKWGRAGGESSFVANYNAAGGGGAGGRGGSVGNTASGSVAGAGGKGLPCSITGETIVYAGGGGGAASNAGCTGGIGGIGGGGNGATGGQTDGGDGVDGLGGGGGGAHNGKQAGQGGNGVVIIRYVTDGREVITEEFRSNTTWTLPSNATDVKLLVVGGGAGGNGAVGAGGGAGQVLEVTSGVNLTPGTQYTITVGAGGNGGTSSSSAASAGGASSIDTYMAQGGSIGNTSTRQGGASGSGNAGGTAYVSGNIYHAGGGAGAGSAGTAGTATSTGVGGDGVVSEITHTAYAAGGGGGDNQYDGYCTGGLGGGGNGGIDGSASYGPSSSAVTPGSGGGGGGGAKAGSAGAAGIVVVQYTIVNDVEKPEAKGTETKIYAATDYKPTNVPTSSGYTIVYTKNGAAYEGTWKDVGEYKATLKLNSGIMWTDGTTADLDYYTLTINPLNLSTCTMTLGGVSSGYTTAYTGAAITPAIEVKTPDNKTLTVNTDYTVSYSDNMTPGQATVTITDKSPNLTGTKSSNFTITKANLSTATISVSPAIEQYTGEVVPTPSVTVTLNGATIDVSHYDVSWDPATLQEEGNYNVTVTAKSDDTYYMGSAARNNAFSISTTPTWYASEVKNATTTELGQERVYVWKTESRTGTSGSITLPVNVIADILVVGGGGAGGAARGGGGGAGGMIYKQGVKLTAGTYNITVGAGGLARLPGATGATAAYDGTYFATAAQDGQNSSISFASVALYTAFGGGAGQSYVDYNTHTKVDYNSYTANGTNYVNTGRAGGSSGGSAGYAGSEKQGVTNALCVADQGNVGGTGDRTALAFELMDWNKTTQTSASGKPVSNNLSGGGGGAGAPGGDANLQLDVMASGNGGVGLLCDITGEALYYAGGGGGGSYQDDANMNYLGLDRKAGLGGEGGGGNGADSKHPTAEDGEPGTGGGGGGGSGYGNNAANCIPGDGGSGIVVIRLKMADEEVETDDETEGEWVWKTNLGAGRWHKKGNWTPEEQGLGYPNGKLSTANFAPATDDVASYIVTAIGDVSVSNLVFRSGAAPTRITLSGNTLTAQNRLAITNASVTFKNGAVNFKTLEWGDQATVTFDAAQVTVDNGSAATAAGTPSAGEIVFQNGTTATWDNFGYAGSAANNTKVTVDGSTVTLGKFATNGDLPDALTVIGSGNLTLAQMTAGHQNALTVDGGSKIAVTSGAMKPVSDGGTVSIGKGMVTGSNLATGVGTIKITVPNEGYTTDFLPFKLTDTTDSSIADWQFQIDYSNWGSLSLLSSGAKTEVTVPLITGNSVLVARTFENAFVNEPIGCQGELKLADGNKTLNLIVKKMASTEYWWKATDSTISWSTPAQWMSSANYSTSRNQQPNSYEAIVYAYHDNTSTKGELNVTDGFKSVGIFTTGVRTGVATDEMLVKGNGNASANGIQYNRTSTDGTIWRLNAGTTRVQSFGVKSVGSKAGYIDLQPQAKLIAEGLVADSSTILRFTSKDGWNGSLQLTGTANTFGGFNGTSADAVLDITSDNARTTFTGSGASGDTGKLALKVTLGSNNNANNAVFTLAGALKAAAGSTLAIDATGVSAGDYKIVSAASGSDFAALVNAATVMLPTGSNLQVRWLTTATDLTLRLCYTAVKPVLTVESGYHTGSSQKSVVDPSSDAGEGYTYGWVNDWTDVGTHSVTATLNANTYWVGETGDAATDPITLTYEILANKITVTFNKNGGSGTMSTQEFTLNEAQALKANTFTRTGYTFAGWATSASGSKKYDDKESVTFTTATDVTLYAKWTAVKYTITVSANGGVGGSVSLNKYTIKSSTQTATITLPTKTGYSINSWAVTGYTGTSPTINGTTLTIPAKTFGNLTLTPTWTRSAYGITYDNLFNFADFATKAKALNCDPNNGSISAELDEGSITVTRNKNKEYNRNYVPNNNSDTFNDYYSISVTAGTTYVLQFDVMQPEGSGKWGVDFYTFNSNHSYVDHPIGFTSEVVSVSYPLKETKTIEVTPSANSEKIIIRFFAYKGSTADENTITYSNIKFYKKSDAVVASATPWGKTITSDATTYGELPSPTLEGATFSKWTLDKAGTGDAITSATSLPTPVASKALWSQWNQVIDVPTADTLTYNGEEQSVLFGSAPVTIVGGIKKAKDAGPYTATVAPAEGYCWAGGSTDAQEVEWSIDKAPLTMQWPVGIGGYGRYKNAKTPVAFVAEGAPAEDVQNYIQSNMTYSGFVSGEEEPLTGCVIDLRGYYTDFKVDCTSRVSNASDKMTWQTNDIPVRVLTYPTFANYEVAHLADTNMVVKPGEYLWTGAGETSNWNDPDNWVCLDTPEGLCRGYPDSMGACALFTNNYDSVTVTIPRRDNPDADHPLGHDFDVGQIYGAGETNTHTSVLTFMGKGTLRASVQLMSTGTICFDNTLGENDFGTPVQYVCPPCGGGVNKEGVYSCNIHLGGGNIPGSENPTIIFNSLTNLPFQGYINARNGSTTGYSYAIFNDSIFTHDISPTATNYCGYELNAQTYANYIFRYQNVTKPSSKQSLYVKLDNSEIREEACSENTDYGNYLGIQGVIELSNKSTLQLDALHTNGYFRGTFILDDSVFEANRGPATVTNLTLKGANSLMRNNDGTINLDGPMAITYPEGSFRDDGNLVAPIKAKDITITDTTIFTINASNLVAGVEGDYPLIMATNTLTIAENENNVLTQANILCDIDGLGLKGELYRTENGEGNEIRLRLTRRFEAANKGTKDLFVPDIFFTDAPTTVSKYSSAQTLLSGTNDNGVVRWHAYVAGFDFTELDTAKMVTKPAINGTITLDSWPATPPTDSGYSVTYSLIRSTNPSDDFTNVEGAPSFKEGSNVPIFALPLPEGDNKLYFYRIKAIYTKEE